MKKVVQAILLKSCVLVLMLSSSLPAMAQYMTRAELLESFEFFQKQHKSEGLNASSISSVHRQRQPHKGLGSENEKIIIFQVMLEKNAIGAMAIREDLSSLSPSVKSMVVTQDLNRIHQYLSNHIDDDYFSVENVSEKNNSLQVIINAKNSTELLKTLKQTSIVKDAEIIAVIAQSPTVFTIEEPAGIEPFQPEKWTKESGYHEALYRLGKSNEEYIVVSIVFRDPFDKYTSYSEQPYYQVIKDISKGRDRNKMIGFEITEAKTNKHYATELLNVKNLEYIFNSPLVSNIVPR